jgi:hypothetical protein
MLSGTRSKLHFIKSLLLGGVGAAAMLVSPFTQSANAAPPVEEPGTSPNNPVMPVVTTPGVFVFREPTRRRWFDPPIVDRFDYSLGSGDFLSFILPPGFGTTIDLYVEDVLIASDLLADGVKEYFFSSDFSLSGVTAFSLRDISPLVDAADSTAFPTFLDFTSGAMGLTMRAREGAPASVPGPLPALGLSAAFAFSRKLRGRVKAAAQ